MMFLRCWLLIFSWSFAHADDFRKENEVRELQEELEVDELSSLADNFLPNEVAAAVIVFLIAMKSVHDSLLKSFQTLPGLSCLGIFILLTIFCWAVCSTYLDATTNAAVRSQLGEWVALGGLLATLVLLTTPLLLCVPEQKRAKEVGIKTYGASASQVAARSFKSLNVWALRAFLVLMIFQISAVYPVFLLASLVPFEGKFGASREITGPCTISLLYLILTWTNLCIVYERLIGGNFAADFPRRVLKTVRGLDPGPEPTRSADDAKSDGLPDTGLPDIDKVTKELNALCTMVDSILTKAAQESQRILDVVNPLFQNLPEPLFYLHWVLVIMLAISSVQVSIGPVFYAVSALCGLLLSFFITFTFWATMGMLHMGDQEKGAAAPRRRLSVGGIEAERCDFPPSSVPEQEANHGMICDDRALSDILRQSSSGDRKFSIGSGGDDGIMSFPSATQPGVPIDPNSCGLGYVCRRGLHPQPNQDSWLVIKTSSLSIYAVFDGHGQKGHDVANFAKENLPKLLVRDSRFGAAGMPDMLKDSFKKLQSLIGTADRMKKLSAQMSGATATVCVHDHANSKLIVAHLGNGACFRGFGEGGGASGVMMTRSHRPELEDERSRIERNGGRVVFDGYSNHRVYAKKGRYPGLCFSRSLGDLLGHADCGMSCEPEISEYLVTSDDKTITLCTSGVLEFIGVEEAVSITMEASAADAMGAANQLVDTAWERWIKEAGGSVIPDLTVILVRLSDADDLFSI